MIPLNLYCASKASKGRFQLCPWNFARHLSQRIGFWSRCCNYKMRTFLVLFWFKKKLKFWFNKCHAGAYYYLNLWFSYRHLTPTSRNSNPEKARTSISMSWLSKKCDEYRECGKPSARHMHKSKSSLFSCKDWRTNCEIPVFLGRSWKRIQK